MYTKVSASLWWRSNRARRAENAIRCGALGLRGGCLRHLVALTLVLSYIVVAWCACALGLDPSVDVNQYAHTVWRVRDGFASGEILALAQTPDGYLWLGTSYGLLRFDGAQLVPWHSSEPQLLPTGPIRSLLVCRDGTLWIGGKGLASWKNGKLTQHPELTEQFVFALREDGHGTVWVGSAARPYGRICSIRGSNTHCYGNDGSLGIGVFALYEDTKGNLWAGVPDGLWRWGPGAPKFYPVPGEMDGVQGISQDDDGALLFGRKRGVYRLVNGEIRPYSMPGLSRQFPARRFLRDRNGGLWIGTWHQGLAHIHQGRTDVFTTVDGLSGDNIHNLFEDREGNIWVLTTEGLDRFRDFAVATLTTKQGLSSAVVGSILADQNGSVWLGTYAGMNRWDRRQVIIPEVHTATGEGKFNGGHPTSLFQDDRRRIWVSTLDGLTYLENGRAVSVTSVPTGNVLSMTEDSDGNVWLINEAVGLIRISPGMEVQRIPWSRLAHSDHASVLAADRRRGGLWIGFFLGGLAYFSEGEIRESYTSRDGLGEGRVSDLYFDADGALWVSTEGGLSRLKNHSLTTLTSKNGLPCDSVHWAIKDSDHSLWLYTACGLLQVTRSEVDAWSAAADKPQEATPKIHVTVFDSSDGVRSNLTSPGHYHPQVAKTSDGKLWFLPGDGVSVIDPHHLPVNKLPPPVHIEKITADGNAYDAAQGLRLPALVQHIDIDYTALSLVAPEKNSFRFKLEGYDRDWRDVGNRRQAFYTNLPPRNYRFRVVASNNSGVWNEAGTSLEFSVLPAFYQTTWFLVLCGVGFLALLWGIYQLRIQELRKQFNIALDARVNERSRIARDLHDTLLQTFHGAMLQFQAARNLMSRRPEEALRSLDDAINETKRALGESRQAIQDLRSEPIAQGNLAEFFMSMSPELAESNANEHSPVFNLVEEGERQTLSSKVSNDICRIALELMRNAYRHAHAQRIETEIRYGDSMFRLRIRDDGKGIDPKVLKEGGRAGHWGLRGVRERAERIGARVELWSEPAGGTEVQLLVPAAIAYENLNDSNRSKLFRRMKRGA